MILNHVSIPFFFKKENDGFVYTVPLLLFVAIYRNKYNDKEDSFNISSFKREKPKYLSSTKFTMVQINNNLDLIISY